MNILGISCFYHDSAACLIQDGKIVAAAQEERFNRIKNSSAFPINAINYCLFAGGITIDDVDYLGFYEKPYLKFYRVVLEHLKSYPFSFGNFLRTLPIWLEDRLIMPMVLEKEIGYSKKTVFIKHHLSHAASAFLVSPFERAAIITADGVGEFSTLTVGQGEGRTINVFKELHYPDSLGLLYTAITTYLGFRANMDEGKVMGLAGHGSPRHLDAFNALAPVREDGSFSLDPGAFGFNKGARMYGNRLVKLLGNAREPGEAIDERHCDIAASLQAFVEKVVIRMAGWLYDKTKEKRLCLAGGVFLNCLLNHSLLEHTPFEEIYVQPAAGDSGGALGVAAYIHSALLDNGRLAPLTHAFLGPDFSKKQIQASLVKSGLPFDYLEEDALLKAVSDKLSENAVVGWFQGRMEFGPRALGNRSILANPCNKDMKDILNEKVKKREPFRPFSPAVIEERAIEFFDLKYPSPFMSLACNVKSDKRHLIPAVTHVDGTARVQTVSKDTNRKFWNLINVFSESQDVPLVLNTSFNVQEPIVCSPDHAIDCFQKSAMDVLALDNFFVTRRSR